MKTITVLLLLLSVYSLSAAPKEVKLSEFSPAPADATAALQAAVDSGAGIVRIDNPGFELLLTRQWKLRSNQELIFEKGVTLSAAPDKFKSLGESLISAVNCSNITLRGEGDVTVKMRKKDYQDRSRYQHSEWRHLLSLKGCESITVRNLALLSSGGDGIYLGCTPEKPYCKDILLEDLTIDDHHRQGISVISAENLMIRRCRISNTAGTAPAAGIDFEPNHSPKGQRLIHCIVEDCDISGNESGIGMYNVYLEGGCPPQSILIRNCRISENRASGIGITTSFHRKGREKIEPPSGSITIENTQMIQNKGPGIGIGDQLPTVRIDFRNCVIVPAVNAPGAIAIEIRTMKGAPVGNVHFEELVIRNPQPKQPIVQFRTWSDADLSDIAGTVFLEQASKRTRYPLEERIAEIRREIARRNRNPFQAGSANWRNFQAPVEAQPPAGELYTRGNFSYVFTAKAGDTVTLELIRQAKGYRDIVLDLRAPSGKPLSNSTARAAQLRHLVTFTAPQDGSYLLSGASGPDTVTVSCNRPGGWLLNRPLLITGRKALFHFAVPAGVTDFDLLVAGRHSAAPLTAIIRDENGKTVAQNNAIDEPCQFRLKRTGAARVLWSVELLPPAPDQLTEIQLGVALENCIAIGTPPGLSSRKSPPDSTPVKQAEYTGHEN